jgi:Arc/MetJ-type ribon-helix-helix transcriptional regulator
MTSRNKASGRKRSGDSKKHRINVYLGTDGEEHVEQLSEIYGNASAAVRAALYLLAREYSDHRQTVAKAMQALATVIAEAEHQEQPAEYILEHVDMEALSCLGNPYAAQGAMLGLVRAGGFSRDTISTLERAFEQDDEETPAGIPRSVLVEWLRRDPEWATIIREVTDAQRQPRDT